MSRNGSDPFAWRTEFNSSSLWNIIIIDENIQIKRGILIDLTTVGRCIDRQRGITIIIRITARKQSEARTKSEHLAAIET